MDNSFRKWPCRTQSANVSGGGEIETFASDRPRTKGGTPVNAYVTLSAERHQVANTNQGLDRPHLASFRNRLREGKGEVPKG